MATNEATSLRNALYNILSTDATLISLCGGRVKLWNSIANVERPVLAFLPPISVRIGGIGHRRRMAVLFGAFARGNDAQDTVEAMTRRVREVLKKSAFNAQGLFAEVIESNESPGSTVNEDGVVAQEARHDLDVVIELSAPLE